MTDSQFGRLVAYAMKNPVFCPMIFCRVEIVDDPVIADFTKLEHA
ncbi:hypothetical protein NUV25_29600 [Burkholderia pseudomultivorans]|nr:hypothetical protein [Burkholderia pseudomultivorans]MDS0861871.1 hypothetical protein [Burkholderia pseudomultivorans]